MHYFASRCWEGCCTGAELANHAFVYTAAVGCDPPVSTPGMIQGYWEASILDPLFYLIMTDALIPTMRVTP
jgi:hypothetical protein